MVDEKKKNSGEEKRAFPRVDFFSRVHVIPEDGSPINVFSSNVSSGGIFLRSNRPLPIGKKVELEFETNNGMVHVDEGEIVWTRPFDPVSAGEQASGMGIKFSSMSEQSRIKIETFVDEILDTFKTPAASPHKPPALAPHSPTKSAPSASAPIQSITARKEPPSPARPTTLPRDPVVLAPPQDSSPPVLSKTRKPPIESPSVENIEPTIIADSAAATDAVDSSISALGPDEFPQHADNNKTTSLPDKAIEGERFMASILPKPHKRVFLFGGFVLLVALVTFFTMFLLKPSGNEPSDLDLKGTKPPVKSSNQPANASSATAKKNEPPESDAMAANTKPAPASVQTSSKPDAGAKTTPSSGKDSALAAKPAKAESHQQPAPAKIKEASNEQLEVGQPVFEKGPQGWQLIIKANRGCEIKHFKLDSPPRLAIDFPKASYSGKSLALDAPAPSISKLRVGKQEWGVRFVIDFQGNEAPTYKLKVEQASITVNFSPK